MRVAEELSILSMFQNLRGLAKANLSRADERLLRAIVSELAAIEVDIWLEQDRRAGKPWTRSGGKIRGRVKSNTAKFAL
jgi:hypothetical protein